MLDRPADEVHDDQSAPLWRFMDFTKYVSMLHRGALFFSRADQVPDPFEGVVLTRRFRECDASTLAAVQRTVFLSCWHENECESAAMWRIYLSSDDGVAIRTDLRRLRACLERATERIHLGRVKYVQPSREERYADELEAFFCKRPSFDYEREVRAVLRAGDDRELGRYVPVDLKELIDEVVISPTAESWLKELVTTVTKKFGYDFRVVASNLLAVPDAAASSAG